MEPPPKVNHSAARRLFKKVYINKGIIHWLLIILSIFLATQVQKYSFAISADDTYLALWGHSKLTAQWLPLAMVGKTLIYMVLTNGLFSLFLSIMTRRKILYPEENKNPKNRLILIKKGKVVEVSNDLLWQKDLNAETETHLLNLEKSGLKKRYLLSAKSQGAKASVRLKIELSPGTKPLPWDLVYRFVIVEYSCRSIKEFVREQIHTTLEKKQGDYQSLIQKHQKTEIGGKTLFGEIRKRLKQWSFCPQIPQLVFEATVFKAVAISYPEEGKQQETRVNKVNLVDV
ncbi:MAG TPA: hypothetical protein VKP03_00675 [Patescibacteria group bacterium]|nr:hypothetical protein [Patescibacteria group bacterium]